MDLFSNSVAAHPYQNQTCMSTPPPTPRELGRIANLILPGALCGQEFHFPHFPPKFRSFFFSYFSSNFSHFLSLSRSRSPPLCLSVYLLSIICFNKEGLHLKPKLCMFCAISQNFQHFLKNKSRAQSKLYENLKNWH